MSKKVTVTIEDEDNRGPQRFDADLVTDFSAMNVAVVPRDTQHGTSDQYASEPNWEKGAYLQDRNTGRPVPGWEFGGRPPQFFIDCYNESNRQILGVVVGRDTAAHN